MESIILSRRDFREVDQIVSLYTKDRGKLDLLARGVKKITSKNAAHLEPFSFVLVETVPGKEIDHLIKVVPIDLFVGIRKDLQKSLAAGFLVSFLNRVIEVQEPDIKIWQATLSWLKFVNSLNNPVNIITLLDALIVKLFDSLGFTPVLGQCVVCGKNYNDIAKEQISTTKKAGFYFSGGGLICHSCILTKEKIGEQVSVCGLKEINDMQVFLKAEWRVINDFEMSVTEEKRLHKLIYEFVLYHSEKKLGDWGRQIANAR